MTNTRKSFLNQRQKRALDIFRKHGGMLHTAQALRSGIHAETLYAMRDAGLLETVSRGLYRLADIPPLGNPDLVIVAMRVPSGVVCLLSALAFHQLTTQIPHEVQVALPRGAEEPRLEFPPLRTFRFTCKAFTEGIETHLLDGVSVRIYCPEKTIADCFKFRRSTGLDVALEALRLYRERGRIHLEEIMRYAEICRVAQIIRPYLEAIFG